MPHMPQDAPPLPVDPIGAFAPAAIGPMAPPHSMAPPPPLEVDPDAPTSPATPGVD